MNAHDETWGIAIGYKGVALSGRSGRVRCLIYMEMGVICGSRRGWCG